MLSFNITTQCDPDIEEGFSAAYASSLAKQISDALPALFAIEDGQSHVLPLPYTPDRAEVRIVGQYTPQVLYDKQIADNRSSVHTDRQETVSDAESSVTVGPPESNLQNHSSTPNRQVITEAVRSLASGLPADYTGRSDSLAEIDHAYRQNLADLLAPALNAHVRAMPHADLEGKKAVCEFLNKELERFGLAIKCPKTGLPAKMKGNPGNWPEIGRFAFEVYSDGKRERSAYSDKLPELQLIDANHAVEMDLAWQTKVGPKDSRSGRKLAD